MNRFLLLTLTAGLLSPIAADAFFGEKDGRKVWSSHRLLDNYSHKIYRTYDSFAEKAECFTRWELDPYGLVRLWSYDGDLRIRNSYSIRDISSMYGIRIVNSSNGIEIKYEKNKAKPFTNKDGLLLFDDYSKYKTIKLRFDNYQHGLVTNTINTSEVKKFIKSYKACVRSTSR